LSDLGAYENEMDTNAKLSERELDLLLSGKGPSDYASLDELAAFFSEAADVLQEAPSEATSVRHLSAIAAAADAEFSQPSVGPSRANREAPSSRPRSKLVFRNPFSSVARKLALASVLVLAAFGGTAYAGALPNPVQGAVSDAAETLGVSLPDGDSDEGVANNVDEGAVNDVVGGTVGDTSGDEGIADDGAANDVNDDDQGEDDQGDQANAGGGDQGDDDQGTNDQGDDDQGTVDQSDQGDDDQGTADQGDQGAADQGDQGDQGDDDQGTADQGDSEPSGDQGDGGNQGDGNN